MKTLMATNGKTVKNLTNSNHRLAKSEAARLFGEDEEVYICDRDTGKRLYHRRANGYSFKAVKFVQARPKGEAGQNLVLCVDGERYDLRTKKLGTAKKRAVAQTHADLSLRICSPDGTVFAIRPPGVPQFTTTLQGEKYELG